MVIQTRRVEVLVFINSVIFHSARRRSRRELAAVLIGLLTVFSASTWAVTINWSSVGNPGNATDPATGYGAVSYPYKIGTYDVTNSQYVEFLNAKDSTGADILGLYNVSMSGANGGINFTSGNVAGSKYSVISGRGNRPVNSVSWFDAIRFANWLNNGQGNGDTESGSYTLLGGTAVPSNGDSISRNPGAQVVIPSEDEWYKAAYYNPGGASYFLYPTSSNTLPTAQAPPGGSNSANYNNAVTVPTDVGAYVSSVSPYGTFDQGGNLFQWNDSASGFTNSRILRGGSFDGNPNSLLSSTRLISSTGPSSIYGFRVASVPEPGTSMLAVVAGLTMRRKKRLD